MAILNDKIVLITGGTSGIGKATAIGLAKLGARVVIACRNSDYDKQSVEEIKQQSGNRDINILELDLSSQKSVRGAVESFKQQYGQLHVLINNAGVMLPKREQAEDGIEKTFAINYLSHFLLTQLLLDTLKASAPSRIVNVSSKHWGIHIAFDDLMLQKKYTFTQAMGQTKLALILFTKELAEKLNGTGVTVNAVHPGIVRTNLLNNVNLIMRFLVKTFGSSPEKGARNSIYVASDPEIASITGQFFVNKKVTPTSANANNPADQKRLWAESLKLTGLL